MYWSFVYREKSKKWSEQAAATVCLQVLHLEKSGNTGLPVLPAAKAHVNNEPTSASVRRKQTLDSCAADVSVPGRGAKKLKSHSPAAEVDACLSEDTAVGTSHVDSKCHTNKCRTSNGTTSTCHVANCGPV